MIRRDGVRSWAGYFVVAMFGSLGACSAHQGSEVEPSCLPGAQFACECPDGSEGSMTCQADGSFGSCDACPDEPASPVSAGGASSQPGVGGSGNFGEGGSGAVTSSGGSGQGGSNSGQGGSDTGQGGSGQGGSSSGQGGSNSGQGGSNSGQGGSDTGQGGSGQGGSGQAGSGQGGQGGSGEPPPPPPEGALAGGIDISEVAIYQAVKVPLFDDGSAVGNRNAPVVIGRDAMIRVAVNPTGGFSSRQIDARLELSTGQTQVITKSISSASTEGNLDSTFNFDVPGSEITQATTVSVSLRERPDVATQGSVANNATWENGALNAESNGGTVRVTIVPFRYNGDGTGRLPDISAEKIQSYKDAIYRMYPAASVDLQVRDVVDYNNYLGPSSGWSSWLDRVCAVRSSDPVDSRTFYYGVMAPADNWQQYAGFSGATAGLGYVPSANWEQGRCSVGLGFNGFDELGLTMAHEVGHTHGLPHAPCGVSTSDPYPYSGASIGSWGYSLVTKTLKNPNQYTDMMSYCDPNWISDYNFSRLFDRIQYVNNQGYVKPGPLVRYKQLLVDVDGHQSWGTDLLEDMPIGGTPKEVVLYDENGEEAGKVQGEWVPFSHAPAGALFVKDSLPLHVKMIRPQGLSVIPLH